MDSTEPPRVVFESAAECADGDRAEAAFRQVVIPSRPRRGWSVTIRIKAAAPPAASAEGEITDQAGAPFARQVLEGMLTDCAGLARAMGTWAVAALDRDAPDAGNGALPFPPLPAAPPASTPAPIGNAAPEVPVGPSAPAATSAAPESAASVPRAASSAPPVATSATPLPAPPVPPPLAGIPWRYRSQDLGGEIVPSHDESAPLELGIGTFLMTGGGADGYLGVTPFLIADVGKAVFVRPSVAIGSSIATNVPSNLAAARLDTCLRLPGRYAVRGGIQLDVCGGADVGFSYVSSGSAAGTPPAGKTLPYVDLGPSVDLRAEAGQVAITLRGLGGINIARQGFDDATGARVDAPAVSWRLELDFSWVLYTPRTQALMAAQNEP